MWDEREQAMHYSTDCYEAIKGCTSEVSDHSTQTIHAWHVAKTRFVTLLSTKVLNSLEKLSWLQRRAFHGIVPHNRVICPTSTQLLWLLQL